MILQRDLRLRKPIREYGCYYMCLLYIANKYTNVPLTIQRINNQLYHKHVQNGAMTANCFIRHPDTILRGLGLKATYTNRHESPDYQCADSEIEILYFRHPEYRGHFVCGDGRGNVTYDPWGVSIAATEGKLVSKRIFRREG